MSLYFAVTTASIPTLDGSVPTLDDSEMVIFQMAAPLSGAIKNCKSSGQFSQIVFLCAATRAVLGDAPEVHAFERAVFDKGISLLRESLSKNSGSDNAEREEIKLVKSLVELALNSGNAEIGYRIELFKFAIGNDALRPLRTFQYILPSDIAKFSESDLASLTHEISRVQYPEINNSNFDSVLRFLKKVGTKKAIEVYQSFCNAFVDSGEDLSSRRTENGWSIVRESLDPDAPTLNERMQELLIRFLFLKGNGCDSRFYDAAVKCGESLVGKIQSGIQTRSYTSNQKILDELVSSINEALERKAKADKARQSVETLSRVMSNH